MRILFAIPHYYTTEGGGRHGSEGGNPERRARAARLCLAALQQTFSESQGLSDGRGGVRLHAANPDLRATITIALCTTGDSHLVPHLEGCPFNHIRTDAEPRYLGFECHKVLRSGLGRYDWFGYLEDDLRLADGLFFQKLAWFNREFGDHAVLHPNRFDIAGEPAPYKLYIDGNLSDPTLTPGLQRIEEEQHIAAMALGERFVFQRVDNPHSGCFFVNAAQLAHWAAQPEFAAPSTRPFGPPVGGRGPIPRRAPPACPGRSKAPRRSASSNISAPTSRRGKTPPFWKSSISTTATWARSCTRSRASRPACGWARRNSRDGTAAAAELRRRARAADHRAASLGRR